MLIGAHVAARGGIHTAVDNALAIGAEVMQTHPTPAQMWRPLRLEDAERDLYLREYAASGLRGHYLHAVYLINLASPKEALLRSSVTSLLHYMEMAASLDADGVVFHPGSHLGAGFDTVLPQVAAAIREVIDRSPPGRARLLVENSAGSGGCVGRSFEEMARIVDAAASDRVGVCLDTQHAFASGYDVRNVGGVARTLDDFDRLIGFERLGLVHANDSARALGSNADRHANIGEGEIGAAGFRILLRDPRMRRVPWVLEVPGHERKGPDLRQVSLLRELAGAQTSGGGASAGGAGGSPAGAAEVS
jgi:deoxyribonuclease-4